MLLSLIVPCFNEDESIPALLPALDASVAELTALAPEQAERMVFLTGGAFTPRARTFLDEVHNPWIEKPFDAANLRSLLRERIV